MAICGDNPLLSVKQEGMGMSDSIEHPAIAQWKLGERGRGRKCKHGVNSFRTLRCQYSPFFVHHDLFFLVLVTRKSILSS